MNCSDLHFRLVLFCNILLSVNKLFNWCCLIPTHIFTQLILASTGGALVSQKDPSSPKCLKLIWDFGTLSRRKTGTCGNSSKVGDQGHPLLRCMPQGSQGFNLGFFFMHLRHKDVWSFWCHSWPRKIWRFYPWTNVYVNFKTSGQCQRPVSVTSTEPIFSPALCIRLWVRSTKWDNRVSDVTLKVKVTITNRSKQLSVQLHNFPSLGILHC